MLREAACQVDSQTDTYCYVEAAQSTHTADLYLYQLPLGLPLPNSSVTSCTSCVQSLMGAYAKGAADVAGFKDTYAPAANMINSACGSAFVSDVASTPSETKARVWTAGDSWKAEEVIKLIHRARQTLRRPVYA